MSNSLDDLDNVSFSLLSTISDVAPVLVTESFAQFAQRLAPQQVVKKSAVTLLSGTVFQNGRKKEHAQETNLLVFDFDNKDKVTTTPEEVYALLRAANVRSVVASSFRHTPQWPKFRAIVVLAEPILPHQYDLAFSEALVQLGFTKPGIRAALDGASANLTQFFYLPSHPENIRPFFKVVDGEAFEYAATSSYQYVPAPHRVPGRPRRDSKRTTVNQFTPEQISQYWLTVLPHLRDCGQEWKCPCPIHQGEKPNFNVNKETGFWFCFSECQSKGLRGGGIYHFHHLFRNTQLPADRQLSYHDAQLEVTQMIGAPTAVNFRQYQQVLENSTAEQVPELLTALSNLSPSERVKASQALMEKHQVPEALIEEHVVPDKQSTGGPLNFYLSNSADRARRIWEQFQTKIKCDKYDLDDDGVYRLQEVGHGEKRTLVRRDLTPQPVWITAIKYDATNNQDWVHLHWRKSGETHSQWVPEKELKLGAFKTIPGFPWDAKRANDLTEYFNDSIALLDTYDMRPFVRETGWHEIKGKPRLMLYSIPEDDEAIYLPRVRLQAKGSPDAWHKLLQWMVQQPFEDVKVLWAVLGMSAAAPLVRLVNIRNPILVLAAQSSAGKSTAAAVAQSIWGDWNYSVSSASATMRAVEDMVMLHQDINYIVDEFQRHVTKSEFKSAEDLLYNLGNGVRRQKVDVKNNFTVVGGEKRYGTVLITSEADFFSHLAPGAQNRCIVLRGAALPNAAAAKYVSQIQQHYGVVGQQLETLYNQKLAKYMADIKSRTVRLHKKATDRNIIERGHDIDAVALAATGLMTLSELFNMQLPTGKLCDYMLSALHPQRASAEQFDNATKGFIELMTRLANAPWGAGGNPDYAVGTDVGVPGTVAVRGQALMRPDVSVYEVMLSTKFLRDVQVMYGLKDAVFADWLLRGFLVKNDGRKNAVYRHTRLEGQHDSNALGKGAQVLLISHFGAAVAAGTASPNSY